MEVKNTSIDLWPTRVSFFETPVDWPVNRQLAAEAIAAVGNAGGNALPTTVIPFLLRGVGLIGIDSASCPYARRVKAWSRIASDLPIDKLNEAVSVIGLADVPSHCTDILEGQIQGRVLVDVNA